MKNLPLLFLLPVSSAKEINHDDLVECDGLFYEESTSVVFTEGVYTEYSEGTRVKNGEIVSGLKERTWKDYYVNGRVVDIFLQRRKTRRTLGELPRERTVMD